MTIGNTFKKLALAALIFLSIWIPAGQAQAGELAMGFGVWQPIAFKGFNAEVDYLTEKWVFEYSHGMNLDISAFQPALTSIEKNQGLKIKAPYSTGFGIGYRFTEAFNLRIEFKEHKFEVQHPNGEAISYINRDIGIGAYYFWRPMANSGFVVTPSLRFWPTLNSTLPSDGHVFSNGDTHKPHSFNFFGNVTLGWIF